MSLPVVLRAEAQAEFDEAFDYYDSRGSGIGISFANRVQETFDRIAANPTLHAVVIADVRKATVKRFPHRVFYRAESHRIEVLAIFHPSRDPKIWMGRA